MRITQVIGGLEGGGAERVCVNLANAWADGGRAVTLLTKLDHAPAYALDPRVRRRAWASRPPDSIAAVLRTLDAIGCPELVDNAAIISMMREAILATEPEIVVAHLDVTNVRVLVALHGSGVPVIVCEHCDVERVHAGRWMRPRDVLYRQAAAVVAPHPAIAEHLARRGARAVAIANPLVAPRTARPVRGVRRRLIALTRLSIEKRPEMLVCAFEKIAAAHPAWDLEIYGEGPLRPRVATLIDERKLRGRVHLRGFAADAYDVLAGADLFVSASCMEAFGNAIWEALACGVPVVAIDCGAPLRSLLRHGVDGIVVGTDSTTALANALASLMGDDDARAAMASRAGEIVERYPIASSLRAWEDVLHAA